MKMRIRLVVSLLLLVFTGLVIPDQPVYADNLPLYAGNSAELIGDITTSNAIAGADTIILTANITLTIVVDSVLGDTGLPAITTPITIEGQGHTISRSSNPATPNFSIFSVSDQGNLTLFNLTISGGAQDDGGGGIYNGGTLVMIHTTVSGNSTLSRGGGVLNDIGSTVTVSDSTFSGNSADFGGGMDNLGSQVTISDSTFSGNSAGSRGGGVSNDSGSTVTVSNSIFSGNSAGDTNDSGGGADNDIGSTMTISNSTFSGNSAGGNGGGVLNVANLTLTNTTFSGNSAQGFGGGIASESGQVTISGNTFSGNSAAVFGGGVFTDPSSDTTIMNSIIANSLSGDNCSSSLSIGNTFDLSDDDTCFGFTQSSTIKLDMLKDNGGNTQTFALLPGSSAIDSADPTICNNSFTFDQRSYPRGIRSDGVYNARNLICDVGAYEFASTPLPTAQFAAPSSSVVGTQTNSLSIPLTMTTFP